MKFAKERVEVIAAQLKKQFLRHTLHLEHWQMKRGTYHHPGEAAAATVPWENFDTAHDHWYGPDRHMWFQTAFTVPETLDGAALWMVTRTQIDEWDDGKNPQFLLFVNGEPVQGLDMNHRETLLCRRARAGDTYDLQLAAYSGTLHTEFRLLVSISELVEPVYGLYYDLQTPLWALARMDTGDKPGIDILSALNRAVNLLDFRDPYSRSYFAGVKAARRYLAEALYSGLGGRDDIVASCIGHTHIDVAWWWTVEQTREKVARSFATVLKLMEEYPEYKFMSSQPQLYLFLKERYPELYAAVKRRVAEGRWEAEGGMWLEADCNLTSGESLVRQFLYGKRFFAEEFGVDCRILWLPDVFGYSAALPQICKRAGIDYFMTTKLSWNQFNQIPCDTFRWRGIDGSEIFTHFISTLGVGQSTERFFTTYNGMLHPDAIMGGWKRYQQKQINNDILIAYGYGDGGGGPTREMLETGKRMEQGVAGIPKVRQVFARSYFEELETRVKDDPRLPTWVGEFYFEYHRGTYTSMARNKRSNRKGELLLMDLELLSVLGLEAGLPYPSEALERLWKILLLNQFHDILPGSSIKEVYEVTKAEYEQLQTEATALLTERAAALAGDGGVPVLFNTLGHIRDDLVCLPGVSGTALIGADGQICPIQMTPDGALVFVKGLPPKGYRSFAVSESAVETDQPFTIHGHHIRTPYYRADFNDAGQMISLYDKRAGREALKPGGLGNLFRLFEDKPIYYDNWDIDVFYAEKYWDLNEPAVMEWTECGAVRATLRITHEFSHSRLQQDIHFYADSPRIDFSTWVDWRESQHLLKVLFELDINTDEASFDIQFGNVTRKTHKNTSWEQARFESCAHRWMDVAESGWGIALLNDCKYGHSVDDGVMGLTLLKAGIEPNPTTDQEEHRFVYALLPHQGGWRAADVPGHAARLNQPVYAFMGSAGHDYSFAQVDAPHVVLETIKAAERGQGVILRIYENQNERRRVTVTLHTPPKSVAECDLLENEEKDVAVENNGFSFEIRPYEIKTFLVRP